MSQNIRLHYSYQTEGQLPAGNVDVGFYRELPGVEEEYLGANGLPEIPLPELEQDLTVSGVTILSSETIATIITSGIKNRVRKIIISNDRNQQVEFEGPSPAIVIADIRDRIEELAAKSDNKLKILAMI